MNIKTIIYFLSCALCLTLVLKAEAAYKIYLKNGSVISAFSYEKIKGEVRLQLDSGVIGIPESEILRIKEAGDTEEADESSRMTEIKAEGITRPLTMEEITGTTTKDLAEEAAQPEETGVSDEDIAKKEEELKKLKEELEITRIRIQALYGGTPQDISVPALEERARALQRQIESIINDKDKGAELQQLRRLLSAVNQQLAVKRPMLQQNMFKKKELEEEISKLEEEIKKLKAGNSGLGETP